MSERVCHIAEWWCATHCTYPVQFYGSVYHVGAVRDRELRSEGHGNLWWASQIWAEIHNLVTGYAPSFDTVAAIVVAAHHLTQAVFRSPWSPQGAG